MKTPYPKQTEAIEKLAAALQTHGSALDASATGLGKTFVAGQVAAKTGRPVGVIAPKIVLPAWRRELAEAGIDPVFVLNFEKIRNGSTEWLGRRNKRMYDWRLPPDTVLIIDECHKCKGERSQNAALHIAATKQGIATLNLSATAASAAPDMRALGFALGLHNDLGPKPGCPSYATWLRKNGAWQDPWRNWKPGPAKYLKDIHAAIFGSDIPKGVRLTVDDMPEAFKGNLVITDPIDFGSNVRKFYEDAGLTSDLVEHWLETGEAPEEEHFLTVVLRARQLAELHKIPATIDMAKDLLDEGKSVAIFMNFNDSIEALRIGFPDAAVVRGGQTGAEREAEVQRFQRDEARVVLLNSAAGGTGVSLHDLHGNHPRVSLISPSFSIFEHEQVLGRIYRNGAQSPALQRVLVASDSIEETVAKVLAGKKKSLDSLLSGV